MKHFSFLQKLVMSIVHFPGDSKAYTKYKHTDGRIYVKCSYSKRLDHHKKAVDSQKIHRCFWVPENSSKNIQEYFIQAAQPKILFTEEELKNRLAILLAKKYFNRLWSFKRFLSIYFILYWVWYFNSQQTNKLYTRSKKSL